MEHQKILDLVNEASYSKLVTRKQNIANDQSNANYDVGHEIMYSTEVLKSNLCDYNSAYSKRDIVTTVHNNPAPVAFKNCAPFIKFIKKIDETTIYYAEDLDLHIPMQNLIEYCSNYCETTGSLWFYLKVEAASFDANIANNNLIIIIVINNSSNNNNNNNNNNFKPFRYQTKLLGNSVADGTNAATAVPLKYLSKFWRSS